jgi:TM2 domain-containing membrane protein YozV/RNA polymerase subunit RPABC4/transcription elongation factor Spt4
LLSVVYQRYQGGLKTVEDYSTQFETEVVQKKEKLQESVIETSKTASSESKDDISTQNVASSVPPTPPDPIIQAKSTKFCVNCGSKIDKNAVMCPSCGVAQLKISEDKKTKFCTNCGSEIDNKAEICPKCGVRQTRSMGIPGEKSPVIAALLSFLLVGLGQVYIGKTKRGIVLFIACIVFAMTSFLVIPVFGALVCWLGGVYDAYMLAKGEPGIFSFIDNYTNEV